MNQTRAKLHVWQETTVVKIQFALQRNIGMCAIVNQDTQEILLNNALR